MPLPKYALAQEDFDRLLTWLDDDREQAAQTYEKIRWRLITIFAARGCATPEDLADETIDRVARRVSEITKDYVGEPARYFFGVANHVHHEFLKRPPIAPVPEEFAVNETDKELIHECLEQCLRRLSDADRQMILLYYSEEKKAKADLHRTMAAEMGVTINTLRLRVLRLKEKLQPCVERCLAKADVF